MGRVRFFIDPNMTDQEILDMIKGMRNTPEVEEGDISSSKEITDPDEEESLKT